MFKKNANNTNVPRKLAPTVASNGASEEKKISSSPLKKIRMSKNSGDKINLKRGRLLNTKFLKTAPSPRISEQKVPSVSNF